MRRHLLPDIFPWCWWFQDRGSSCFTALRRWTATYLCSWGDGFFQWAMKKGPRLFCCLGDLLGMKSYPVLWGLFRNHYVLEIWPTGATNERTPKKPEYPIAHMQLTERGPLGFGLMKMFDGFFCWKKTMPILVDSWKLRETLNKVIDSSEEKNVWNWPFQAINTTWVFRSSDLESIILSHRFFNQPWHTPFPEVYRLKKGWLSNGSPLRPY